jgi:DNA (cytosine-5)-methyltransferase 1
MMDIDVDNFCGGGGASTGLEAAMRKPVDIAVNHSEAAIAMHKVNHPDTKHYREDVWEVDPREAACGRRVRVLWLSPDCTHHSRAKGGKPKEKGVRGLAWVAIRWVRTVRPRVVLLENVEEFEDWGPLDDEGNPIKAQKGETFRAFVATLISFGYSVDWRRIVAADHGSPTTRKRLFMVARSDGRPIVWPEATHGAGRSKPWRTAAEIIDWSLPTRSIFDRKKPLADATMRRIAAGLKRYVIDSPNPFIVPVTHQGSPGRVYPINEPMRTVTAANRGELMLAQPFIAPVTHTKSGDRTHDVGRPLPVVTTAKGGEFALVTPFINTQFGQSVGRGVDAPVPTITGGGMGHQALCAPILAQTGYGERRGQAPRVLDLHKPLGTVVTDQKHALVTAFVAKHYGGVVGHGLDKTLGTVTTQDHHSAVEVELAEAAWVEKFYGTGVGAPADAPLPTVTANGKGGGHLAEVRAFLVKYYGDSSTQRQPVDRPIDVVTTKARFGLVTVAGIDYQIVDIGLRMLSPRELFRAQGFGDDYQIDIELHGKRLTKTAQIELAGNSVCPQAAEALAGANLFDRYEARVA